MRCINGHVCYALFDLVCMTLIQHHCRSRVSLTWQDQYLLRVSDERSATIGIESNLTGVKHDVLAICLCHLPSPPILLQRGRECLLSLLCRELFTMSVEAVCLLCYKR